MKGSKVFPPSSSLDTPPNMALSRQSNSDAKWPPAVSAVSHIGWREESTKGCVAGQPESGRLTQKFSDRGMNRKFNGIHHFKGTARPRHVSDEYRYWVYSTDKPLPSGDRFVLLSFNILGVDNATQHWRELYPHIPPYILNWDRRKGRILLEIGLWSPDVLCLQEVDRFDDLQEELGQQGYNGVFKGRTGEASDGCAMFWRKQRFSLLQEESIEFKEWDLRNNVAQICVLQGHCREEARGMKHKTENINQPRNCVIFCNIHVLFNPNRGDIKIGQVRVLLKTAHALSRKWGGIPVVIAGDFNSTPQSPLYQFLSTSTLDLSHFDRRSISGQVENSHPMTSSRQSMSVIERERRGSPLELHSDQGYQQDNTNSFARSVRLRWDTSDIEKSSKTEICEVQCEATMAPSDTHVELSLEHREMQAFRDARRSLRPPYWSPEELKAATGSSKRSTVVHRFKLRSAYSSIKGPVENRDVLGEPLVTTYHGKFMGTVDYIWYTEGLCPVRVLDVLPVHVLKRTRGLPSKKWGSDHLALACEFGVVTGGEVKSAEQLNCEESCDSLGDAADLSDSSDSE